MSIDSEVAIQYQVMEYITLVMKMENTQTSETHFGLHEFLRKHGEFMAIDPIQPELCSYKSKQCYYFSQLEAAEKNYIYCEGLAVCDKVAFPVFHAWCLNQKRMVIDPTWSNRGVCYFGIKFNTPFIQATMHSRKKTPFEHHHSLLESNFIEDSLLLKNNPPTWKHFN